MVLFGLSLGPVSDTVALNLPNTVTISGLLISTLIFSTESPSSKSIGNSSSVSWPVVTSRIMHDNILRFCVFFSSPNHNKLFCIEGFIAFNPRNSSSCSRRFTFAYSCNVGFGFGFVAFLFLMTV